MERPGPGASRHEDVGSQIDALWFARKAALDGSDALKAQARVEELRAYLRHEGITAETGLARGFAYEGYENLREGNYERARDAFDLARAFDPFLHQAQLGYAWSLLRSGRGFFPFVDEYARGLQLAWSQFLTNEILTSNAIVVAAVAALVSLTVFSLLVVARCQGRVRHDLSEAARRVLPAGGARLFAWVVFLLPLLAWAGGVWLVLFWLVLCFRYMRTGERLVALSVFILVGLSPATVLFVADRFQAASDPEMRAVVSALRAGYSPNTVRGLERVVSSHDGSMELHLLLGTSYAKGERLEEAFQQYQHVLQRSPSHPKALLNTGNVYFRLGEYGQAVSHYKRSIEFAPDQASAYWNLHLAQTEMLHLAEAQDSLAKARDLDQELVGALLARKKDEAGPGSTVDEPPSLGRLRDELRAGATVPRELTTVLANPMSVASGAGFLLCLLLSLGNTSRLAASCSRCGGSYCARCRLDAGAPDCCARCAHLNSRKGGITAEVRSVGMARLHRRDRVTAATRRILSLVLPGSGLILAGRLWLGFFLMTGWVGAGAYLASRGRLLLPARVPVTDLPAPGLVLAAALAICLWIAGNAASTRRSTSPRVSDGA